MRTRATLLTGLLLSAAALQAGATAMRQGADAAAEPRQSPATPTGPRENPGAGGQLTLSSPAFRERGEIPGRFTCDGKDVSPPLSWTGVPSKAKSLALIVDDPDAPDPASPQTTWVHWVLYDIPPGVAGLGEGIAAKNLPAGSREGLNDWQRTGYGGPCPPVGRHRYFFKLYALDTVLQDSGPLSKAGLEAAMKAHIIMQTQLMGTYQKRK